MGDPIHFSMLFSIPEHGEWSAYHKLNYDKSDGGVVDDLDKTMFVMIVATSYL